MKPRLLDLFCGAGGASEGYHDAGFDIVGVDIAKQPGYRFVFIQSNALDLSIDFLSEFDVIHASPPCQSYSSLAYRNKNASAWPRLIRPIRKLLKQAGRPYIIENVVGAPLIKPTMLCGTMFEGLRVLRHRLFETSFQLPTPPHHRLHPTVHSFDKRTKHYGKTNECTDFVQVTGTGNYTLAAGRDAMRISWMTKGELNEAIPPAYTRWIGEQLIKTLERIP